MVLDNRNAGTAGTRFVDLKRSEMHKANFAVGNPSAAVMEHVENCAWRRRSWRAKARVASRPISRAMVLRCSARTLIDGASRRAASSCPGWQCSRLRIRGQKVQAV
jgi:hypothetical protein